MRANEFITERRTMLPSIREQIKADIQNNGGSIDDYFVRFSMVDQLGFSGRQWFGKSPDVDHPQFSIDYVGHKHGRRALWFYPASFYLKSGGAYGSEQPYVFLVKLKPNAWLQPVKEGDNKVLPAPEGKERVGILRTGVGVPSAIFFTKGYDLVGKYTNYKIKHKKHGEVKGPPPPPPKKTFLQKLKDKFL